MERQRSFWQPQRSETLEVWHSGARNVSDIRPLKAETSLATLFDRFASDVDCISAYFARALGLHSLITAKRGISFGFFCAGHLKF